MSTLINRTVRIIKPIRFRSGYQAKKGDLATVIGEIPESITTNHMWRVRFDNGETECVLTEELEIVMEEPADTANR